jgi:hypothetical protein
VKTRASAAIPVLFLLLLGTVSAIAVSGAVGAGLGQFELGRLNRGYREVAPEIQPIEEGPVTIRLSSPRNSLIVRHHLLRLEPGIGNSHSAELRIEFMGKGWLVADVEVGGASTRFQDEVQVPPQALEMQGRVRLRRVRGGYEVTPEQLPQNVRVRIQSGIGRQIVNLCDGVSVLPFTEVDCAALEQELTRVAVPLPAAGESFFLEDAEMTAQERQHLDSYLIPSKPGSPR